LEEVKEQKSECDLDGGDLSGLENLIFSDEDDLDLDDLPSLLMID
jgi:hypothetical protein